MSRIPIPTNQNSQQHQHHHSDHQSPTTPRLIITDSPDKHPHHTKLTHSPNKTHNSTSIQSHLTGEGRDTQMSNHQRSTSRLINPRSDDINSHTTIINTNSSPSQRVGTNSNSLSETRQRQSRRDEAIRKKIETELQRKRTGSKKTGGGGGGGGGGGMGGPRPKRQAGTVSALRPLPALTVPDNITVADASQLCAAKRTDCVLVVDEEEHLCGIFTAKDLAYRVIGEGLDPRSTPVSAIMTSNPMVTRDTTSATEALTTMVTRGFRHLPVCNEEGDVVGLLDITKVFHESLEKLERAYGSSQKLYNAIEGVQSEFGNGTSVTSMSSNNPLMAYVEALREKMAFPDIGSILDARTIAATVGVKTSVRDAAALMRENHTTAVCIMENDGKKIAGIFTSKDVVLRVIAAGLDARTCSVVRVMTPHPDTALPSLSIQEALRKMHDGHYLNLPVVDENGVLQGCVDVLKLTYATLEQVNSISADGQTDESGGPLWSRFFASFGQAGSVDDDNTSIVSGSNVGGGDGHPRTPSNRLKGSTNHGNNLRAETPGSELAPNDSASVIHDDSESAFPTRSGVQSVLSSSQHVQPLPIGYDDGTYLFKFVAPSGSAHRFQARYDSYEFVREIVEGKIQSDPFISEHDPQNSSSGIKPDPHDFQLAYFDDDNDLVLITCDQDVNDSVELARRQSKDRVVLHLRGGKTWGDLESIKRKNGHHSRLKAVTEAEEIEQVEKEEKRKNKNKKNTVLHDDDKEEEVEVEEEDDNYNDDDERVGLRSSSLKIRKRTQHARARDDDRVGGIPKDMVLPAAVGFLGFVILGVFLASRPK